MRVVTKLVRMEFVVGQMTPNGDNLVISSGGDETAMKVKAYIEPEDVTAFLRAALHPAVIGYFLRVPVLLWRRRRSSSPPTPKRMPAKGNH